MPVDPAELAERATEAAQTWRPGTKVIDVLPLEGGTVSIVFKAVVTGGGAADQAVVLKVAPPGVPPVRNRDVLRQGRYMAALGSVPGVAVPKVLFDAPAVSLDVPPFVVTELVAGVCREPQLGPIDEGVDPTVRERAFNAVRMMAKIRSLRPADIGLAAEPQMTPTDEVERWTRTFETVPDELRVGFQEARAALLDTVVPALPPCVIHGDYRLGNMLCEGERVNAIIDWELAAVADPRIDLTWMLFFTAEANHPTARPGKVSGMPTDVELLSEYERCVGVPTPDLEWFHCMTRYKEAAAMALILKLARKTGRNIDATGGYVTAILSLIEETTHRATNL